MTIIRLSAAQRFGWLQNDTFVVGGSGYNQASTTMDAVDEKVALLGTLAVVGGATSKVFSSAGAKLHFRTANVTWAGTTTVRIGLQAYDATTQARIPDGVYTTYGELIRGTDTVTANTWTTCNMSSGTATLSHGDDVAIVFHMTARGGSDRVDVNGMSAVTSNVAATSIFTTVWVAQANNVPAVVVEFDDGTFATLKTSAPYSVGGGTSYSAASNPDEYAQLFTVPFRCTVNGAEVVIAYASTGNENRNATVSIYSDPTGTPVLIASDTVSGAHAINSSSYQRAQASWAAVTLEPGVVYACAVKAEGSSTFTFAYSDLGNAEYRVLFPGGTDLQSGTRNNSSGAFGSLSTTRMYPFWLLLSGVDDGNGLGRASFNLGV